jgi:hypothetical protein
MKKDFFQRVPEWFVPLFLVIPFGILVSALWVKTGPWLDGPSDVLIIDALVAAFAIALRIVRHQG